MPHGNGRHQRDDVPAGFVRVPAGTAVGGSPTVIEHFCIAKYETTNRDVAEAMQWAYNQRPPLVRASSTTVRTTKGSREELLDLDAEHCQISFSLGTFSVDAGKEDHPCVEITWRGAAAYCNFRSAMEERTPCYDLSDWSCDFGAGGYRLPTDKEWEYAARGGKDGRDTAFSGSNDIDAVAWYFANSGGRSHKVGTKAANELGIHDMSGNVWEWCHDWYTEGVTRVERGGSWMNILEDYCRVSNRYKCHPDSYPNRGFRPAMDAPKADD